MLESITYITVSLSKLYNFGSLVLPIWMAYSTIFGSVVRYILIDKIVYLSANFRCILHPVPKKLVKRQSQESVALMMHEGEEWFIMKFSHSLSSILLSISIDY